MKNRVPWLDCKIHIVVLFIVIISMLIGIIEIPLKGTIKILLFPLVYSLFIGLALYLYKPIKFVGKKQSKVAGGIMAVFIGVLIAKLGVSSGQSIDIIIQMGPVLILKQIGCLGSLIALPVGLFIGFKREVIGMSTSICRDPSLSIIMDKYGFNSPETRGVLIVFIIGSIIGTVFISLLSSGLISILPLHPYAYAMACGVGSASMSVAGVTPIMHLFPSMASDLEAFTACSNLITTCVGIYIVVFVAIPIAEKLYKILNPLIGEAKDDEKLVEDEKLVFEDFDDEEIDSKDIIEELESKDNTGELGFKDKIETDDIYVPDFSVKSKFNLFKIGSLIVLLLVFSFIVAIGNWVGYNHSIINCFMGMIMLSIIAVIGMVIEKFVNVNIPSIVYVSLVGMFLAFPQVPTSNILTYYVSQIDLSVICTVFLAYVGIAIGNDWHKFERIGFRGSIITCVVIGGTFLISLLISQWTLVATGMI